MFRMTNDVNLLRAIADGITQLRVWHLIGTEVEVPEIYEFTHSGKDYTLEITEGHYTLKQDNNQYIVVVARTACGNLTKQLFIFENKESWSDWAELAGAHIYTNHNKFC